jgi:hypothetical protein
MTASRFLRAAIPAALAFLAAAPLFAGPITPVVTLSTVADTGATLIPGGTGTFTSFNPGLTALPVDPCVSGGNVTFWGAGTGGQQGIYAALFGSLTKVADQNTAIPGGTGNFVSFPPSPVISGQNVVFVGNGGNAQQGVYQVAVDPVFPPRPGQGCRPEHGYSRRHRQFYLLSAVACYQRRQHRLYR